MNSLQSCDDFDAGLGLGWGPSGINSTLIFELHFAIIRNLQGIDYFCAYYLKTMRKKTIALIISIAALALMGIIIIQVYWMRNALQLQEELFNNSVNVTLKSVVNRMFDERQMPDREPFMCGPECDHRIMKVLTAINPARLDSLLHEEFDGMEITREYVWGVFDPMSKQFFAGETGNLKSDLLRTDHTVSLSCLYRNEQLMLGVYFPNENSVLMRKIIPWMAISLLLLLVVVFAFSYMIFLFMRQKKLSELKSDFVNNMTHELKTPISTISLASEMLLSSNGQVNEEKARKYARMIYDENLRMQQQVEQVLQMAVLEEGSFKLNHSSFDAHEVIARCISRFELMMNSANGSLRFMPGADFHEIEADVTHFQNIICNLLDNAVKYSAENPDITVRTRIQDRMFVVAVQDKGLGINHENQKMVFDKLYRVPTGNLHDVKGFGLGLYYVKTVIEALGGYVKVHSELNKGSIFEIYLPLKKSVSAHE